MFSTTIYATPSGVTLQEPESLADYIPYATFIANSDDEPAIVCGLIFYHTSVEVLDKEHVLFHNSVRWDQIGSSLTVKVIERLLSYLYPKLTFTLPPIAIPSEDGKYSGDYLRNGKMGHESFDVPSYFSCARGQDTLYVASEKDLCTMFRHVSFRDILNTNNINPEALCRYVNSEITVEEATTICEGCEGDLGMDVPEEVTIIVEDRHTFLDQFYVDKFRCFDQFTVALLLIWLKKNPDRIRGSYKSLVEVAMALGVEEQRLALLRSEKEDVSPLVVREPTVLPEDLEEGNTAYYVCTKDGKLDNRTADKLPPPTCLIYGMPLFLESKDCNWSELQYKFPQNFFLYPNPLYAGVLTDGKLTPKLEKLLCEDLNTDGDDDSNTYLVPDPEQCDGSCGGFLLCTCEDKKVEYPAKFNYLPVFARKLALAIWVKEQHPKYTDAQVVKEVADLLP